MTQNQIGETETVVEGRLPPPPERRPRCQVLVSRGTGETGSQIPDAPPINITRYVRSVRTMKDLSSPCGTFALTLTFEVAPPYDLPGPTAEGERLARVLQKAGLNRVLVPDNVVEILLDAGLPDSQLRTIMIGWVTHVGAQTTLTERGPQRVIVVRGQDAGKFLLRHHLPGPMVTQFLLGEGEARRRAHEGLIVTGTVGDALRQVFTNTFQVLVPAPQAVVTNVRLATHPALDGEGPGALQSRIKEEGIWRRQGRFWSLLSGFIDPAWNECFGDYVENLANAGFARYRVVSAIDPSDSGGAGYFLIARPRPFTPEDWESLRTTEVFDTEIRFEETHRSDDERVNLVMVLPIGKEMGTSDHGNEWKLFETTHFSRASAADHGTQPLVVSTLYSDLRVNPSATTHAETTAGTGPQFEALIARARRLWDWYAINHQLWKGALVVAGNPLLKIGERVQNQAEPSSFFTDEYERRVYYVERVIHDYSEDGRRYLTHLGVTRGQPLGQMLQAPEPERLATIARPDPGDAVTPAGATTTPTTGTTTTTTGTTTTTTSTTTTTVP